MIHTNSAARIGYAIRAPLSCLVACVIACLVGGLSACGGREEDSVSPAGNRAVRELSAREECADILEIDEERLLIAELLAFDLRAEPFGERRVPETASSEARRSAVEPKIYLAHMHYLRGESRVADVYIRTIATEAGGSAQSGGDVRFLGRSMAQVLYRFQRARMALEAGSNEEALAFLDEEFFTLLAELLELAPQGSRRRDMLYVTEAEATDLSAAVLLRQGREVEALELYERLWSHRGVKMRQDRFVSYALLLADKEEGAREKTSGNIGQRELARALRKWSAGRPFDPAATALFERLYRRAGLDCHLLLLKAEELEYRRPLLDGDRYREVMEELTGGSAAVAEAEAGPPAVAARIKSGTNSQEPSEGLAVLNAALALYAEDKWSEAAARLSQLRELDEGLGTHRFLRYVEGACRLRACGTALETDGSAAAEMESYFELEEFYADFASFYRHIWEAALELDTAETAVAEMALRAAVRAAPDSRLAQRARELLWRLQGLSAEDLPPGLPLLPIELERIADFVGMGAPPYLLEPAVAMLGYEDNLYSLNAELTLRGLGDSPAVYRFLAGVYETAEGRLRERLSAILRLR